MRRMTSRGWLWCLVLTSGLCTAWAARADRIDAKEKKARIECASGNYAVGVRLLAELWVATDDPTWIYNQGRCYEQNGQSELAVNRFREYLRKAERIPAEEVEAVKQRIRGLEPATAPSPLPLSSAIPLPPAAPQPTPPPSPALQLSAPSSTSNTAAPSGRYFTRWWFWAGVGAVVAGGVVTAVLLAHPGKASPACDTGVACVR